MTKIKRTKQKNDYYNGLPARLVDDLRGRIAELGWPKITVANKAGMNSARLSNLLTGREEMTLNTFCLLAKTLELKIELRVKKS